MSRHDGAERTLTSVAIRFRADVKCNLCRMVTTSFDLPGSLGLVTDFSECCQPAACM